MNLSRLSQSTSSAIKNHSGVKTCRVAETRARTHTSSGIFHRRKEPFADSVEFVRNAALTLLGDPGLRDIHGHFHDCLPTVFFFFFLEPHSYTVTIFVSPTPERPDLSLVFFVS